MTDVAGTAPPSSQLRRLWGGHPPRKSRLHTYKGRFVDSPALLYLPKTVYSTVLLKLTGRREAVPWLGYRVVKRLEEILTPDSAVLEYGSGMSTIWLAARCKTLVSVESSPSWHEHVAKDLAARGLTHVDYRLLEGPAIPRLGDYPDEFFDLVIVDGELLRDQCARTATQKVKRGGYVLFDNSDLPGEEFREAERVLLEACDARGGDKWYYSDLYPFIIAACESLLVRL